MSGAGVRATRDQDVRQRVERDADPLGERSRRAPVLLRVAHTALGEHRQQAGPRGRRAADVTAERGRLVAQIVPRRAKATAEVDLLAVEEEALVEAVDLLERASPHEDARAGDPV